MAIEVAPAGLKPTKTCSMCGQVKDTKVDFYWTTDTRGKRRPGSRCKVCHNAVMQGLHQRYREGRFVPSRVNGMGRARAKRYGITEGEVENLRLFQGDRCAICWGRDAPAFGRDLSIDHDHETGRVRGLLCGLCNRKLGWFESKRGKITAYLVST